MKHLKFILKGWSILLIPLAIWFEWKLLNFLGSKGWLKEVGTIATIITILFLMYCVGMSKEEKN